jgi:hypothetical protein
MPATLTRPAPFNPDQVFTDMQRAVSAGSRELGRTLADALRRHIVSGGAAPHPFGLSVGAVADEIFSAVAPDCDVCRDQTYLYGGKWVCEDHGPRPVV